MKKILSIFLTLLNCNNFNAKPARKTTTKKIKKIYITNEILSKLWEISGGNIHELKDRYV